MFNGSVRIKHHGQTEYEFQDHFTLRCDGFVMAMGSNLRKQRERGLDKLYNDDGTPISNYIISTGGFKWHGDHESPMTQTDLPHDEPDVKIIVFGSGLSGAGVTSQLGGADFSGSIHMISSSGLLPKTAAIEKKHYNLQLITDANLPTTANEVKSLVMEEVKLAQSQGYFWQNVIDAITRPMINGLSFANKMWQNLPFGEKKSLYQDGSLGFWRSVRNRMSIPIANGIDKMGDRFQCEGGKIQDVIPINGGEDGFKVIYTDKNGDTQSIEADFIINTTGLEACISNSHNPLVRNLDRNDRIQPGGFGKGIMVDKHLRVINPATGKADSNMFVIGVHSAGEQFLETALIPHMCAMIDNQLMSNFQAELSRV